MGGASRRSRLLFPVLGMGLLVLLLFSIIIVFLLAGEARASGTIYHGVKVGPVDLGGLRDVEARGRLEHFALQKQSDHVRLIVGEKSWEVSLAELGAGIDVEEALVRASRYGREGYFFNRLSQRWHANKFGAQLPVPYFVREDEATAKIAELAREVNIPPTDASLSVGDDDSVHVLPAAPGREVDLTAAVIKLKDEINHEHPEIRLEIRTVPPGVETSQIEAMQIKGLMSVFVTKFNPANTNRVENIQVAAAALHDHLIAPGETFSFNQVVGPRSTEAGYKEAIVIEENELRPGVGGGVCQVSTTLYNAVLRANLPIAERRRHSLVVDYVPVGTDATVVYGITDLKFINDTTGYLLLRTRVAQDKLTVKIFGNNEDLPEVTILSEVEEVIAPPVKEVQDPALPASRVMVEQEGKQGYRTKVTRLARQGGLVVSTEVISRDLYPPVPRVVRLGTGPVQESPVPAPVEGTESQGVPVTGAGGARDNG